MNLTRKLLLLLTLVVFLALPLAAVNAFKGAEEFTAMTGISVTFGDVPFGSFQEQLYLEASNPNTEYDIVAFVDAWGTNIYDYLHPLNDFVMDAGIDWDDYGPAYQSASTGNSDTIYGLPFRGHPLAAPLSRRCPGSSRRRCADDLAGTLRGLASHRGQRHGYRARLHVLRPECRSESVQLVQPPLGRRHRYLR